MIIQDFIAFSSAPPIDSLLYNGHYDAAWVITSVLISILTSYAAVKVSSRVKHQHEHSFRLLWTLIGALTLGIGSWAMHFIGMLAFDLPCGIYYDPLITVVSMVPGILAAGFALSVVRHYGKNISPLLGSTLLGAGIGTMHYTGMAAMRIEGYVRYDPTLFALSIIVAVALSYLALRVKIASHCMHTRCNVIVAVIMGGAISGMHYTAMSSAYFVRGDATALPSSVFSTNALALLVAVTTIFLALAALALAGISRNREMTEQLRDNEERWKFALESAGDGVWDWNPQTDKVIFSTRWKAILGYGENEFPDNRTTLEAYIHPDDLAHVTATVGEYFSAKHPLLSVEYRIRSKDGSWKWVLSKGKQFSTDAHGNPLRIIGTQTDITERKLAENSLRIAAIAFEAQEGIMVTDHNNQILRVNNAFSNITGYTPEEIVGKNPRMLGSGRQDAGFYKAMWESIKNSGNWSGEIWNRRKNGEIYPEYLNITAVKNQNGKVTNYVATLNDISESKAAADEIKHLAFYDPLTRLPNRRLLLDRLVQAKASGSRNNTSGALLFIDLDHFKVLNDTFGHDMGDLLLQQVAQRLESCIRQGDTVARLGGDEFVVMLEYLSKNTPEAEAQTEAIGEKIMLTLNQPYLLGKHEYHSTPSIGATLFNNREQKTDELFKQADIAMYQAKKTGRNTMCFFDPVMQERVSSRAILESELRSAIAAEKQILLYYQAQVESSGRIYGAEALVRWQQPVRGLVSPAEFIPLAEETGLILPLGYFVLKTACQQLAVWAENPETRHLTIAVNISSKQFHLPTFVEEVFALVDYYGIDPDKLKLEITESMLLDKVDDIIAKMFTLKERGIRFSMDDFGTGYSSLQYLKHLPIDQLKIDQSFVRDIATDDSDRAIVRTIIAMAKSLKLDIIAEGVETEAQQQFLTDEGCNHFQGYLFSKPVPIGQFEVLLKQN